MSVCLSVCLYVEATMLVGLLVGLSVCLYVEATMLVGLLVGLLPVTS